MTVPGPTGPTGPTGNGRTRPTGRALAVALVAFGLANLAVVSGSSWFVLLAGGAGGVLGVGLACRARIDGLQVELAHPPRSRAGDQLPVRVTVRNAGARTSSETQLCLHTAGLADLVVAVGRLAPGARTSLPVERLAARRAVADGTVGHLVSRPGLGLVAARRELLLADQVVVHPALVGVPDQAPTPGTGDDPGGRVRAGTGPEVLGPREWRSGDDRGRLHWRTTARTGRPTLLERGAVETRELRLAVVGSDTGPAFEAALSFAASVCDTALTAGSAVTAVAWHRDGPVLAPVAARWELLDWWAAVRDTVLPPPAHFGQLALAGFGPGAVLVVGPPEADSDWFAVAAANSPGLLLQAPVGVR